MKFADRPLVWLAASFLMGIATAIGNWPWLGIPVLILALWDWRRAIVALCAFGLGWWHRPDIRPVQFASGEFRATMQVISVPEQTSYGIRCLAAVESTRYHLRMDQAESVQFGDWLQVEGEFQPISEAAGFGRGAVAEVRTTGPVRTREGPAIPRWGSVIAQSFAASARANLSPESASLVEAVCFNRVSELSSEDWDAFRRFGVVHLLSASGFHVFVVAAMLLAIVRLLPIPRPVQIALVTFALVLFACAAGLRPPIVRSVLMSLVMTTAYLWRREPDALSALGLAAIVTTAADPFAVADIGFHLSILSTAALAVTFERYRHDSRAMRGFKSSVAAIVATLPITAFAFGEVSLFGLLGNLLVSPVVAALVIAALVAWLLGIIVPPLGEGIWATAEPLCELTRTLNAFGANLPGSALYLPGFTPLLMVAGVGFAFIALIYAYHRFTWIAAATLIAALGYEVMLPHPREFVAFLQVGQGDCTVIRRANAVIMIDAAPRTDTYNAGIRMVWPKLRQMGINEIDVLVISHPDLDHAGGMAGIAERVPIHHVVASARFRDHAQLQTELSAARLSPSWISSPSRIRPYGLRFYPGSDHGSENMGSLLTVVQMGSQKVAFSGDAPAEVEQAWINQLVDRSTILKAGHHGSGNSTSDAWLKHHQPEWVVFSSGRNNSYGHPAKSTIERSEAADAQMWRTDRNGDLLLVRQGEKLVPAGFERFDPLLHFFNR